ncbi:MAG: ParA family protein [Negativicutes bacterium]
MKTISISNFKGGVGKTVVAAKVANELARMGYLTVMIDLGPQCDLSKMYQRENTKESNIFQLLAAAFDSVLDIVEMTQKRPRKAVSLTNPYHESLFRSSHSRVRSRFSIFSSSISRTLSE